MRQLNRSGALMVIKKFKNMKVTRKCPKCGRLNMYDGTTGECWPCGVKKGFITVLDGAFQLPIITITGEDRMPCFDGTGFRNFAKGENSTGGLSKNGKPLGRPKMKTADGREIVTHYQRKKAKAERKAGAPSKEAKGKEAWEAYANKTERERNGKACDNGRKPGAHKTSPKSKNMGPGRSGSRPEGDGE